MNINKKLGIVILVLVFAFGLTTGLAIIGLSDRHERGEFGKGQEGKWLKGDVKTATDTDNIQDPNGVEVPDVPVASTTVKK